MSEAFLNRVIYNTFIDGPGSRMAFFLQGCNIGCLYCHNPETQRLCDGCGACVPGCPAGALRLDGGRVVYDPSLCVGCDRCLNICPNFSSPKYRKVTDGEVADLILSNADFLDGVTFSGGECTLQPDFLCDVFSAVKKKTGLTCFIDTNGFIDPAALGRLMEVTDGFMFDLKAFDPKLHKKLTGADNGPVLENLRRVAVRGLLYEVRTVVVEGFTDSEEEIKNIASFVAELDGGALLKLIRFRPIGVKTSLSDLPPTDRGTMLRLCSAAQAVLGDRVRLNALDV